MNTIEQFYDTYFYPHPGKFQMGLEDPNKKSFSATAPFNQAGKEILLIGSGVTEGSMTAYVNPESTVYATDISKSQITISKSFARKLKIKNIRHSKLNIEEEQPFGLFDNIVATGVLHHIPDVRAALTNIRAAINEDSPNATFSGMVYANNRPGYIRDHNAVFLEAKATPKQAMAYLHKTHNEWFNIHVKHDVEIADTWLHPYFKEYGREELGHLLFEFFPHVVVYPNPNYQYHNMFIASLHKIDKEHVEKQFNMKWNV